jgi:hypothetical protein
LKDDLSPISDLLLKKNEYNLIVESPFMDSEEYDQEEFDFVRVRILLTFFKKRLFQKPMLQPYLFRHQRYRI